MGDRPPHHRRDPLAHPLGRLVLVVPDRHEHAHHVRGPDPVHPLAADAGKRVGPKRRHPLARVPVGPVRPVHVEHLGGRLLERRHGTAALRPRVAARPGHLAVGDGRVPGLGQRHEADGAEPQLPALAVDEKPLDPLLVAGWLDAQHEAMLVPVQARFVDAPHEGGGEFSAVLSHPVTLSWSPRRSPFPYWNGPNGLTRQYNISSFTSTTSLALSDSPKPRWTGRYRIPRLLGGGNTLSRISVVGSRLVLTHGLFRQPSTSDAFTAFGSYHASLDVYDRHTGAASRWLNRRLAEPAGRVRQGGCALVLPFFAIPGSFRVWTP